MTEFVGISGLVISVLFDLPVLLFINSRYIYIPYIYD